MMTESSIATLDKRKSELRLSAKASRANAAARAADAAAAAVCARVIEAVRLPDLPPSACPISAYWPMGSEIDPRPLMQQLHERGHPIGLPVVIANAQPLSFRAWRPGDRLQPAGFGTRVPGADQAALQPRVLIVPLLAFDRAGYRLGYGGGYYDRTLDRLRRGAGALAIGIAYAAQEVAEVPTDRLDQPLDWIVTEREAIAIGSVMGSDIGVTKP